MFIRGAVGEKVVEIEMSIISRSRPWVYKRTQRNAFKTPSKEINSAPSQTPPLCERERERFAVGFFYRRAGNVLMILYFFFFSSSRFLFSFSSVGTREGEEQCYWKIHPQSFREDVSSEEDGSFFPAKSAMFYLIRSRERERGEREVGEEIKFEEADDVFVLFGECSRRRRRRRGLYCVMGFLC